MVRRLCTVLLIITIMAGCTNKEQNEASPDEGLKDNTNISQVEDSKPTPKQNISNKEIATHLANVAGNVRNVSDASAIIAGPYAVVAIDVDKDLNKSRVGTIKYSAAEALHNDPYGKAAVVIADGDVVERVRKMRDKVSQGYPVQGVVDELAAIVGRYMPQMPIKKNRPKEPDQNKEIMPKDQKKELNQKQQEHSNKNKD